MVEVEIYPKGRMESYRIGRVRAREEAKIFEGHRHDPQ